jgi:hypothetical protein
MVAQSSVVHEEVHIDVLIVEPIGQGEASIRQGQIGCKNPNIECGLKIAEMSGERFQAVIPTSYKYQAGGMRSKLVAEFLAETG